MKDGDSGIMCMLKVKMMLIEMIVMMMLWPSLPDNPGGHPSASPSRLVPWLAFRADQPVVVPNKNMWMISMGACR